MGKGPLIFVLQFVTCRDLCIRFMLLLQGGGITDSCVTVCCIGTDVLDFGLVLQGEIIIDRYVKVCYIRTDALGFAL